MAASPSLAASAPAPAAPAWCLRDLRVRPIFEALGYALVGLFIFFTCFTFLKPSPYDFTAIPAMLLWFLLGIRLHRGAVPLVAFLLIFLAAIVASLVPYVHEEDPVVWTYQTAYLVLTGIFFAMFFADETRRRVEFALKAYVASCLFAAVAGIMSYFDTLGTGVLFKMDGRAAGVFEDPNVLGSFLFLAVFYLVRNLLTGEGRHPFLALLALPILLAGIFLSFSRGSWGATVVGLGLMTAMTFWTARSARIRRRIVVSAMAAGVIGAVAVGGLLTVDQVAQTFQDRATVTKDYDEGETGRFGAQLRGTAMLIERPLGFGPLRWRRVFGLEPHNSYIGGFANGGWAGGFAFMALVLATTFVGFRLCLTPSPYQRLAQIVWPALFMFFLQAIQIDVEKWRHVYMMLGMMWGMEAARLRWLASRRRQAVPEAAFA